MSKRKKNIEDFFTEYETNFKDSIAGRLSDLSGIMQHAFADYIIESTPAGVSCIKNDETFLKKIRQGQDFYRSIGSKAMSIVSKEVTLLDDFHAMVKIYWRYAYEKENRSGAIDFHTFYFVRAIGSDIKIFGYIAGDEQKVLKEHGLIERELLTQ
ncbi:MAG: hypothetical protein ACOYXT_08935 [Bacteroidota bacterium]